MYRPGSLAVSRAGNVVLADADDIFVAIVSPVTHQRVSGDHFHKPDLEASRLFAAAPDMLAALELVANSGLFKCFDDGAWFSINAAIAKAKGE